ncbi:MAG: hypothetical protein MJ170_01505 [Alphaproteobacteria bacterium]|nr:hypothetical protein [Alphaproteobacteria bacterium]
MICYPPGTNALTGLFLVAYLPRIYAPPSNKTGGVFPRISTPPPKVKLGGRKE